MDYIAFSFSLDFLFQSKDILLLVFFIIIIFLISTDFHSECVYVYSLIKKVPPEAERKVFYNVASQIFSDGVFNWGRVVALFYFAYKVCVKVSICKLLLLVFLLFLIHTSIIWIYVISCVHPAGHLAGHLVWQKL